MDQWPEWKKERIIEIIGQLNLPKTGKALDFGCGRGIFTEVLKRALPDWEVSGTDISQVALDNASAKFPDCHFLHISALHAEERKFDLIFSHHVLEHVSDLEKSIHEISLLQKKNGIMLHVLPCGNEGSMEYKLAQSLPEGRDAELGNRFYFEDIGHLRRINSVNMDKVFEKENYSVKDAWFANHKYGSLEWMSDFPASYIEESITNKELAQGDAKIEAELLKLRKRIARLKTARKYAKQGKKHRIKVRLMELKSNFSKVFGVLPSIMSDIKLVNEGQQFEQNLEQEWPTKQNDP